MEKFAIGVLLGGITGALLTANNYKMRTLVRKGQQEAREKIDKFMDEKIEKMEENAEEEEKKQASLTEKKGKKAAKASK